MFIWRDEKEAEMAHLKNISYHWTLFSVISKNSFTSYQLGLVQIILVYFIRGSITVRLASCFSCLDSTALHSLNYQRIYLFGWIQTQSKQEVSCTVKLPPYEVREETHGSVWRRCILAIYLAIYNDEILPKTIKNWQILNKA